MLPEFRLLRRGPSARLRRPPCLPFFGALRAAFVILAVLPASVSGQSLRIAGGVGPLIPVGGFEKGENLAGVRLERSRSLRAEVGWISAAGAIGHPEVGLGILGFQVPRTDELGTPISVYGFSHLPLFRAGRVLARLDASLGATFGWRAFDPVENPRQVAIGSSVTAFFQFEATAVVPFSSVADLTASAGYRHFSNGNLRPPNIGLNTIPLTLGLRIHGRDFTTPRRSPPDPVRDLDHRGWAFSLMPFVGARGFSEDNRHTQQDSVYIRQRLPVAGMHVSARRRLNPHLSIGLMSGTTWDASGFRHRQVASLAQAPMETATAFTLNSSASLHVDMGPARLELGVGIELFDINARREVPRLYQRLGAHFLVGAWEPFMVLRALNFDRPNYIEWGLGIPLGF